MASEPQGTLHWFGVSWSLAIEEQFYLILPLIVYYTPRRALYSVFAAGIIGAVLLRLFLPGAHAFVLTPWRADSLLSGAMLALLVRRQPFMSWVALHRSALVTVFFALLAGAAVMIAKPWAPWARSHFWLAMFYTCFLLVALNDTFPMLTRFLTSGWLVWLGKVSYAVYLFHPDVAGLLFWFINRKSLELKSWSDYLIVALAVLTTLGLAALSFRLFEGPLVRFGHRFKYVTKEGGPFWAGRNTSS